MPLTSTSASAATLWLIRHGESTWNTLGLAQGHDDQAELTSRGQRQAAEVAGQFHGIPVRAVYASDLRRAQQTAAPLAAVAGVPVVLDARLRERGLGVLEGTPADANGPAATGLDLKAGRITDPDKRPTGGESVRDLYRRAAAFLDDLAAGKLPAVTAAPSADSGTHSGTADSGTAIPGDVVIVAHGGTLRVLAAYLSGVPVESMDWAPLANATVMNFPHPRGGAR
ncbi:MAG TPA: histidine phosphatase family protein [Trebonia sp.]|jgi:probable phosphoglycerate mutase|nr:histidine phosphatase family protein [Trebonia sp.]